METLKKTIRTLPKDYITRHLLIVNGLLPNQLTRKEIQILASFMGLHKELTKDSLFNTEARKRVMKEFNMVPAGLSYHLTNIIKKGLIIKEDGLLKVHPSFFPEENGQNYIFKLEIKED